MLISSVRKGSGSLSSFSTSSSELDGLAENNSVDAVSHVLSGSSKIPRWVQANAREVVGVLKTVAAGLPPELVDTEISKKFLSFSSPICGALFVFGGRSGRLGDSRKYLKSAEYLDPMDLVWRAVPDMAHARVGLAAVFLNNAYYVLGGYNQINNDSQRSVEKLDIYTMQWTECASLTVPRYGHSACACRGMIYVMGGDQSGVLVPFAERYDPVVNVWERIPDMPIRVAASRAVCLKDKVFVFGGCDPSVPGDRASDSILMFDPDKGLWTVLSQRMSLGRTAFSIAPLGGVHKDGVVIAGGFDLSARPEIEMTSVEVLEGFTTTPSGDKMETTPAIPPLPMARAGCQGVTLSSGDLPLFLRKTAPTPIVVLGGEYVDPVTSVVKIFDTVTILVQKELANANDMLPVKKNSSHLGTFVRNVLARGIATVRTTENEKPPKTNLSWCNQTLPPMSHPRTAFAACVGSVWPIGFPDVVINDVSYPDTFVETSNTVRTAASWSTLLNEWFLQGNVF